VEIRCWDLQSLDFMLRFKGEMLNFKTTGKGLGSEIFPAAFSDENFAELHAAVVNGGLGVGDWLDDVWTSKPLEAIQQIQKSASNRTRSSQASQVPG
jgi:hypothetical protein